VVIGTHPITKFHKANDVTLYCALHHMDNSSLFNLTIVSSYIIYF